MDAEAGRFPTGRVGLARDWDGHAWAVEPVADPSAPEIPSGGRSFLRTARFWLAVLAVVAGYVLAWIAADEIAPNRPLIALGGALACGGALLAMTFAIWRRLRLSDAIAAAGQRQGRVILLGLASGLVALVVALALETLVEVLGGGPILVLFLAGPIEESGKLLLPVIIFFAARKRLADPRVAFAVVWVSAAVFGVVEGVKYLYGFGAESQLGVEEQLADAGAASGLVLTRTFVEMLHPVWTAAAAAVMWIGAWRGRALLTGAGLVAFLTAVALHSINDGVIGGLLREVSILASSALWPVWFVVCYQVFRRHARELLPPSRVADSQRRWRPHVKPAERGEAVATQPTPTRTTA